MIILTSTSNYNCAKQEGLSLIELLVALSISSLLMLGVSNLYFNSQQTDQFTYEISRVQESGRAAIDFLAKDIRMAGYQGCLDPNTVEMNIIAVNPPTTDFFETTIRGFETHNSGWSNSDTELNGSGIEALNISGSDVLAIQGASVANAQLTGNMNASNANIQINDNSMGFQAGDVILIADCTNADMFRATSVSNAGGKTTMAHTQGGNTNTDNRLSVAYQTDAQIMFFESVAYFVGDTGRVSKQGFPINALYRYRHNLNSNTFVQEELIPNVDSMQLRFGERLNNNNFVYNTADNVTNWQLVETVQLGLLVSGTNEVIPADDNNTYILPGEDIEPETNNAPVTHAVDRRLRKTFNITINLRNRRTTI